jgi:hypothetical protein
MLKKPTFFFFEEIGGGDPPSDYIKRTRKYRASSGDKEREKENQKNYKADASHKDICVFQLNFALRITRANSD